MNKKNIFELLKKYIKLSNSDLQDDDIRLDSSFETLGINSLDKMSITTQIISELSLTISLADIFLQSDIGSLVDLLAEKN